MSLYKYKNNEVKFKMKKIISVSRRTDIPAFYGEWFMNRVADGFAGYINPYGGQKYIISLKQEDVDCFVFWSKNYYPFIENIKLLKEQGYNFYFNYTITGLPKVFESNVSDKFSMIDTLITLSTMFSSNHINWRYDPIVISDVTDYKFHLDNFAKIASRLAGYVNRCYFSFAIMYGKVKRNVDAFKMQNNISIIEPDLDFKICLANDLAKIANNYGITMYSCCGDFLINDKIKKAHCIDGDIINELFHNNISYIERPTRKECGCTVSTDIGTYDTCPHGCVYCYANINKKRANELYVNHDPKAAFLGQTKEKSDKWVKEIIENDIAQKEMNKKKNRQLSLL